MHLCVTQPHWANLGSGLGEFDYSYKIIDNLYSHTEPHLPYHNISMMMSSNGNIFRVTGPLCGEFTGPGEFPTQRPVTRGFDVFFDLRLNKPLSKQPSGWWFETPSWSLWRHCNVSDIIWALWHLKSLATYLFFDSLFSLTTKKHQSSILLVLCEEESTSDHRIPFTKGEWCRKYWRVSARKT